MADERIYDNTVKSDLEAIVEACGQEEGWSPDNAPVPLYCKSFLFFTRFDLDSADFRFYREQITKKFGDFHAFLYEFRLVDRKWYLIISKRVKF